MKHLATFLTGAVFGLGIAISGMANPAKVVNFFDVAGAWDPSLAFVMGGALIVTAIGYRLVWRRTRPVWAPTFDLPQSRRIDLPLVGGSALFGVGWGIAGFCPGGALPALGTLEPAVLLFTLALIGGMLIARALMLVAARRAPAAEPNRSLT
ncbi:YeeE/YedE family protein [Rhodobacteraceae bacterium CCMM004]|nr:YeeE/YedE family protein [Rhodobacteraceae bacterium CCMM004]